MTAYLLLVYLLGAVPFGLVVTTLYGNDVDIRRAGSGNIGATNVGRVFGWRIAAAVLALDIAKGFFPTLFAWCLFDSGIWWPCVVGLMAFVGHCWPVYLQFRGGKGVATAAGVLLALAPVPTLGAAAVWGGLLAGTGRSSIAALGATLASMFLVAWWNPSLILLVATLGVGILVRHLTNIGRLVRGEESEIVRPVRWGGRARPVSAEEVLAQGPGGGEAVPVWKGQPPTE